MAGIPWLNGVDNRHLYLPEDKFSYMTSALGTLAAPQHMVINKDAIVVCKNCPKPSDPNLLYLLIDSSRQDYPLQAKHHRAESFIPVDR